MKVNTFLWIVALVAFLLFCMSGHPSKPDDHKPQNVHTNPHPRESPHG